MSNANFHGNGTTDHVPDTYFDPVSIKSRVVCCVGSDPHTCRLYGRVCSHCVYGMIVVPSAERRKVQKPVLKEDKL